MLAGAAARGAYYNVLINVHSLPDPGAGVELAKRARSLAAEADALAGEAAKLVEVALNG
jgi:formiminotetrahydrofolate cyclodeaminase